MAGWQCGSLFEDEVARERGIVVEQSGVFAELDPDEVVRFHRQHHRLTAGAVPSPAVSMHRNLTQSAIRHAIVSGLKLRPMNFYNIYCLFTPDLAT